MNNISDAVMREFLRRSINSFNENKLRGLLAEVAFRKQLHDWGLDKRVSVGGWIARSDQRVGPFGEKTVVFFPHIPEVGKDYAPAVTPIAPRRGLHTICATFRQLGISSYYCVPVVHDNDNADTMKWKAMELGIPDDDDTWQTFPDIITGFGAPSRRRNLMKSDSTGVTSIPNEVVAEEFAKEHLRVTFQTTFMSEIADLDGLFWGQQHTYPIEIKEKTVAGVKRPAQTINGVTLKKKQKDSKVGPWFGIDIGPFTKLAFFASKRGNLHAIFVVREIDNEVERNHVDWWVITYDRLAEFAAWNYSGGGQPMVGMDSATVKVPRSAFEKMTKERLENL